MRIYFLIIIYFTQSTVIAQINWSYFDKALRYDTTNGLPTMGIFNVKEDKNGFIWIPSNDGVIRFDGLQFEHYTHYDDGNELKSIGPVNDVYFDNTGVNIYLPSRDGILVASLDETNFKSLSLIHPHLNLNVNNSEVLYFDLENKLWIGAVNQGLFQIDFTNNRVTNYRFESNVEDSILSNLNSISVILNDNQNSNILWLGTHQGIIKLNKKTHEYEVYYHNNKASLLINLSTIIKQTASNLYVGSFKGGWYVFDKETKTSYQPIDKSSSYFQEYVQNFFIDDNNNVWVTSPEGLVQYHIDSKKAIKGKLSNPGIGISFLDSRGIIWCTVGNGLYRYDTNIYNNHLEVIKKGKEDSPNYILNIIKIKQDYYICPYFGEGIYKINGDNYDITTIPINQLQYRDLGGYLFRDMTKTHDNNLLILGDNKVVLYNTALQQSIDPPVQIPDSTMVYRGSITMDNNHNYWIGTHKDGLFKVDFTNNQLTNYQSQFAAKNPREHRYIKKLFVDSKNKLWIGQASTSVMDLETLNLRSLNPELNYSIGEIFGAFYEDEQGKIWIANVKDGISYVWPSKLEDGLSKVIDGSFSGVYKYRDSLLWTIGKNGLGILNTSSGAYSDVKLKTKTELTGPVVKMEEDKFMIGCLNGVIIYSPVLHIKTLDVPKPYIQEVRANNKQWYQGSSFEKNEFTFPSGTKSLNVKIGALAFNDSDQVTYHYRIDDVWVDLIESKEINLSNLKQGNYSLALKAINGLGKNADPVIYNFQIKPYWYTTNLAILIYNLLIACVIFTLYKFNLKRRLAIIESGRLKEMDELKSKMFANISHEFKTPLTIIKGLTNLFQKQPISDDQLKLINSIDRSSDQLSNLINQMLDLASLDANKMETHYKNGDVIAFIKKSVDLYRSYSDSRLQKLKYHGNVDSLKMDFDDDKLQKVLNNLLSNAIKFTPPGGKIKIQVENKGDKLVITISDSGSGIKRKHLPLIFERHFKTIDVHGKSGSGIGLALTKELVNLLGGSIVVKSKKGKGTTFTLELPIKNEATQTDIKHYLPFIDVDIVDKQVEQVSSIKAKEHTILLVEDNKDLQNFILNILNTNYNVIIANNGVQGLDSVVKKDIDFIISDVMMPKMDGFEFCRKIKSQLVTSHIPIIMLSARSHTADKQEAYKLGVDGYLTKPFNPDELLLIIANILQKKLKQKEHLLKLLSLNQPEVEKTDINKLDIDLITKLQTIILETKSKLSAQEISKKLFVSRTQLHRKIKSLTGKSLTQYANHIRLEKAKYLLSTTNLQINEIAYFIGFESPNYFIRIFKKEIGTTPEEYRKSLF